MIVIGLDLSLTAPGLSVGELHGITKRTETKDGDRRYCAIRDWIEYHLRMYRPNLAVVEAVPPYTTGTAVLERVHGITRELLARHGVPYAYVSPTSAKLWITGSGRAEKQAIMDAVREETGWSPGDDNQADAWVLRRMGELAFTPEVVTADIRAHRLTAMSSVVWPLRAGVPGWLAPYGQVSMRKPCVKKCGHGVMAFANGGGWLHPFNMVRCDKPPK